MSNLPEAAWLARRRSSLDGHLVFTLAHLPNCQAFTGGFASFRRSAHLDPGGIRMTDRRFYLLLALLLSFAEKAKGRSLWLRPLVESADLACPVSPISPPGSHRQPVPLPTVKQPRLLV